MRTMFQMIDNNPFYKLFWLVLIGAVLFLVVRIVQRYVLAVVKDEYQRSLILRWEYRAVTIIWLVYGSWALYHLIKSNFIVTLTILAIVMVAGWRSWMEFFAGIFLRLERRIELGDMIQTQNGSGKVVRFHFQSMALRSDEGHLIHLPYSRVSSDVVAQSTNQEKLLAQSFTIHYPNTNTQVAKEFIKNLVYRCPWTAVLQPVNITFNDEQIFTITARTIDKSDFHRLEAYVKKRLEKGKKTSV